MSCECGDPNDSSRLHSAGWGCIAKPSPKPLRVEARETVVMLRDKRRTEAEWAVLGESIGEAAAQVIKDLLARLSCVNPERVFELRKAVLIESLDRRCREASRAIEQWRQSADPWSVEALPMWRRILDARCERLRRVRAMTYRGGR